MKQKLLLCLLTGAVLLMVIGCETPNVVSCTVADKTHTEQYAETYSTTVHKYNWLKGEFQLIPEIKTRIVPESWTVDLLYEYDNGTTRKVVREVSLEEWEAIETGAEWEGE